MIETILMLQTIVGDCPVGVDLLADDTARKHSKYFATAVREPSARGRSLSLAQGSGHPVADDLLDSLYADPPACHASAPYTDGEA